MSVVEGKDTAKASDLTVMLARKQYAYPTNVWKEERAQRLYQFLKTHQTFTRESLRNWLYRELYVLRLKKQESPFIRKVLSLIISELTYKEYVEGIDGYYKTLVKPSLDECLRILRLQIFDLWR
jgi:dephospho-CoA kinase